MHTSLVRSSGARGVRALNRELEDAIVGSAAGKQARQFCDVWRVGFGTNAHGFENTSLAVVRELLAQGHPA